MKSKLIYQQTFKILKILFYLIPISLIIGNAALNINTAFIIINLIFISFFDENFYTKYRKIFLLFLFFFILLFINFFFSISKINSLIASLGIIRYFF